jgi:hypothetical protein
LPGIFGYLEHNSNHAGCDLHVGFISLRRLFPECPHFGFGPNTGISADLDEILVRQRSARKLGELATDRERSKIDADEADPVDQFDRARGIEKPLAQRMKVASQKGAVVKLDPRHRCRVKARQLETPSGAVLADHVADQLAALPPLTSRYTRIALTQKLRRIIDEAAGYGLALEGISPCDVVRSAAAKS